MRELGQEDSIYRNYDLRIRFKQQRQGEIHTYIIGARERMGLETTGWTFQAMLADIRQKLVDMRYTPPDNDTLHNLINSWYIWDRIRTGALKQWTLRKRDNPLL